MVQSTKMIVVSLMSLATIASGYLTFNGTNICCDGVIGAKTDQCCGVGQPYNTTEKVCCDSKLFDPPGGNTWNYSCCYVNNKPKTSKLYNIHTQVCCTGIDVFNKINVSSYYGCCKDGIYDYKTSLCCNDATVERGTGKLCCGNKWMYDPKTELCANAYENNKYEYKILTKINDDSAACGFDVFDKKTQFCAYSYDNKEYKHKVLPKSSGVNSVCGFELYDRKTQICVSSYENRQHVIKLLNKTSDDSAACGLEVYDRKTQICATSFENEKNVYRVLTKTSNNSAACGLELYDRTTQACCPGANRIRKVVPNKGIVNPGCCLEQPYDYKTQICCASGLLLTKTVSSPQIYQQCCGTQLYEFSKQVCCNNSVFDRQINNPGVCCAGKYQTVTGSRLPPICCGDNVQAQSPNYEFSCCSGHTIYNRTEKICCGDKVQDKKTPTTLCCFSNNVFDYKTEVCTATGITKKEPEKVKGAGDEDVKGSCGPAFKLPFLYDYYVNPIYFERHREDVF